MKKSMFGLNIDPNCAYCENYIFENEVTYCLKGKQIKNDKCRHFKYDPLMRVPKVNIINSPSFTIEDFKL